MGVRSSVAGVVLFPVLVLGRLARRLVRGCAAVLGWPVRRLRPPEPSHDEVLGMLREHRGELSRSPREVLARAERAGVSRRTLWRWLRRHGVKRLELSLAAGLGEEELRQHLSGDSLPPVWGLEMLADTGPVEIG